MGCTLFDYLSNVRSYLTLYAQVIMHRLIDLCLEVVVKNLSLVDTIEVLPDEILQKLLALCRRDKVFVQSTRELFRNTKMTKLDFHQDGDGLEVCNIHCCI